MKISRILVVGANGQLGSVLTKALQEKYGIENVIASDIRENGTFKGIFKIIDATNFNALDQAVKDLKITEIYHLAAILSANGEKNPIGTWDINMKSWMNVLEVSRLNSIQKVFYPSSIAVFGEAIDREYTTQNVPLIPATVYGISKAASENWGKYYFDRYGLDVRSVRYPGIIGYQSKPGGGTTDYAVDIFYKAILQETFVCFLEKDTVLPMMYMEDAVRAALQLMDAPKESIKSRTSYNIAGMSFSPAELFDEIKKHYPNFKIVYQPDFRQAIASSWPKRIVDTEARNDWHWKPNFDTIGLVEDMILNLRKKELTEA